MHAQVPAAERREPGDVLVIDGVTSPNSTRKVANLLERVLT
jgi:hypothetical protein